MSESLNVTSFQQSVVDNEKSIIKKQCVANDVKGKIKNKCWFWSQKWSKKIKAQRKKSNI